jgi:hypothetical protein
LEKIDLRPCYRAATAHKMQRHSASYPNPDIQFPFYLRPIRLVRAFRSDFKPIPYFLQDLLAEAPCHTCSENQSRIIELLKNIQFQQPLDERCEGKLWFEIRRLLKRDTLSDGHLYSDGRAVRNHLLRSIRSSEDFFPTSPSVIRISQHTKKVEVPYLRSPVGTLTLTRQTSQ